MLPSNGDAVGLIFTLLSVAEGAVCYTGAKQLKIAAEKLVAQNFKPVILTQSPGLMHHNFECKMTDSS